MQTKPGIEKPARQPLDQDNGEAEMKVSMASLVRFLMRYRRVILMVMVAGVVALVGMGLSRFFKPKPENKLAPVLTVAVERAKLQPVHQHVHVTGSIWPWDPLSISSEVNGLRIESTPVEEGSTVKKGQVLATLNSAVLRAELNREEALLAAAEAGLTKAIQPNRREDINGLRAIVSQSRASVAQQKAQLAQAQANLINARHNAKRYKELLSEGAVSAQEAEGRSTASTVAEAEVRNNQEKVSAAEFNLKQSQEKLSMAESGGRKEDIAIARADVDRGRANVQRLRALIEQTIIRAPADGLVTKREAHIGDTSTAGKVMFTMVRENKLELRAQVPERDLMRLSALQQVEITSSGLGDRHIIGYVRQVSPQVDPDTRLGMLKIDLPPEVGLKPGMFVEGSVLLPEHEALTVPSQAVVNRDDKFYVFVLSSDSRAVSRTVEPGARDGNSVEILSGIDRLDQVIVAGAGFLKDGDLVKVAPVVQTAASGDGQR